MSFMNKSDVKNHLSTHRHKKLTLVTPASSSDEAGAERSEETSGGSALLTPALETEPKISLSGPDSSSDENGVLEK